MANATGEQDYEESAGLRQTFQVYLPPEVGDALQVVTAYLYDRSIEAGDAPGHHGYVARELRALQADLAYLTTRFGILAGSSATMTVYDEDRSRLEKAATLAKSLRSLLRRSPEVAVDGEPGVEPKSALALRNEPGP